MQGSSFDKYHTSKEWVGGPTHHLQKQHIPGYSGHVNGLISENLYGQPFAKLSSDCLNERIQRGVSTEGNTRYRTINMLNLTKPGFGDIKDTLTKTASNIFNSAAIQTLQTYELLNE